MLTVYVYSTKEASIAAHCEFSRDSLVEDHPDQAGIFYQRGLGD